MKINGIQVQKYASLNEIMTGNSRPALKLKYRRPKSVMRASAPVRSSSSKKGRPTYTSGEKLEGYGLPYAPENWPSTGDTWTWKTGRRILPSGYYMDRYLEPPPTLQNLTRTRRALDSKRAVEGFVRANFPGADVGAFMALFEWKIPSHQIGGPLLRDATVVDNQSGADDQPQAEIDESSLAEHDSDDQPLEADTTVVNNEPGADTVVDDEPQAESAVIVADGTSLAEHDQPLQDDTTAMDDQSEAETAAIVSDGTSLAEHDQPLPDDTTVDDQHQAETAAIVPAGSSLVKPTICLFCQKTVKYEGEDVEYNHIRCEAIVNGSICGQVAHTMCSTRADHIIDADYYCKSCGSKNDLIPHAEKLLKICESMPHPSVSRNAVLAHGITALRNSDKTRAKQLHAYFREQYDAGDIF